MDLNSGLTQVLQDGTNTYLYGAGRVAQYSANGPGVLPRRCAGQRAADGGCERGGHAGAELQTVWRGAEQMGGGATSYGFTNEWTDASTGDVYLRARWYAVGQGRFLTKDTWEGDYTRQMSMNGWVYVYSNPINLTDPSGYCTGKADDPTNPNIDCWQTLQKIEQTYSFLTIDGKNWEKDELLVLSGALDGILFAFGNDFRDYRRQLENGQ